MKDIVIVSLVSGFQVIDIANELSIHNNNIVLLTGKFYKQEREINSRIIVKNLTILIGDNYLIKFISWILFTLQVWFYLVMKYRNYHIFYFTLPPVSFFSSLFSKNKFSVVVYDIYPDVLKVIGIQESHLINKIWTKINRKIYRKANIVYTISEGLKQTLSRKYIGEDKIKVVYGWPGLNPQNGISFRENHFLSHNKWNNKFIILYSGSIGEGQKVNLIFKLSEYFRKDIDIQFILAVKKGRKKYISKNENLYTTDYLPSEDYSYLLSKTKLSLIFMNEKNDCLSFPSKIYNSFSFGIPLLSIAPHNSEIAEIISEQNCGKNFEENQFNQITEYINTLKTNPGFYKKLSENSKSATEKYNLSNVNEFLIDDEK